MVTNGQLRRGRYAVCATELAIGLASPASRGSLVGRPCSATHNTERVTQPHCTNRAQTHPAFGLSRYGNEPPARRGADCACFRCRAGAAGLKYPGQCTQDDPALSPGLARVGRAPSTTPLRLASCESAATRTRSAKPEMLHSPSVLTTAGQLHIAKP